MTTETRNTEPRGPSRADIRHDLANRARHWFDLWESEGFYVNNVQTLRLINIPRDALALVVPANVIRWALASALFGFVIWMALAAVGR